MQHAARMLLLHGPSQAGSRRPHVSGPYAQPESHDAMETDLRSKARLPGVALSAFSLVVDQLQTLSSLITVHLQKQLLWLRRGTSTGVTRGKGRSWPGSLKP